MGLFDNLFKKKNCDICGGEIGLLGNRKLEDGNLCKDCAAKLSPWFDDRRHSTVEMIRKQLELREANKNDVQAFQINRIYGENTKIYVDEQKGNFIVTSAQDPKSGNPDVIALDAITNCEIDINEGRTELMREDADGNEVSYSPKRYSYDYDFYIRLYVNHPYIDDIHFKLNSEDITIESRGSNINPELNVNYRRYNALAEEIKEAMLNRPVKAQAEAPVASAASAVSEQAAASVTCPYCGATTSPDADGNCEYCGGPVNG